MNKLDETDKAILRALKEDSQLTTKELAAMVNLSSTPVFERIKRLENEGYIKKYIALIDAEKMNYGFIVYCSVKLKKLNHDIANDFINHVQRIPEVTECYNISGKYDFLLKIYAPSMKYYQEFVINVLGRIESVGTVESSFEMSEIKHEHNIPF